MNTTPPTTPAPEGLAHGTHPPAPQYAAPAPYHSGAPVGAPGMAAQESDKSFIATWLLAWLLGGLGADRFYLGKIGTAILKLVTFGGFGIWTLIDLILVLAGATRDKLGRRLSGFVENRKIAWIVTGAVVAISLVIGAISGAASGGASTSGDSDVLNAPAEEVAAEVPADDLIEEEEPEAAPAEPAEPGVADWATEHFGSFEPVSFSGSSDDVLSLPADAKGGIVTVSHDGDGHFAASIIDANNQSTGELLVNTVGSYTGSTAWGITSLGEPASLQISASGSWTVTISPMSTAPVFDGSTEGSSDQVLLYGGDAATMAVTNDGSGHFAVQQDTGSAFEFGLLVNDVGPYSGNVAVSAGPSVIVVTSDGTWSLAIG